MLTLALSDLERAGLVARTQYPTFPPRVEYEVTAVGREFSRRLRGLQAWMHAHGVCDARSRSGCMIDLRSRRRA